MKQTNNTGILTFQSIMLTAVRDGSPELDESFTVRLEEPIGGGTLNISQAIAVVTILENQDPFGVFQITTSSGSV